MKQLAIASLVGTLILFFVLALMHTVLPVHLTDIKYTPAQDTILSVLSSSIKEDGMYYLPTSPPGTSRGEQAEMMQGMMDKPWAMVMYHGHFAFGPAQFIMGFIYNFISILIICIALAAASSRLTSFGQRLWFVMLFALFALFANVMLVYNYWFYPMHFIKGQIIDILVGYLFAGTWLAWYYGRITARTTTEGN